MPELSNRPICVIPARGGSKRIPRKNIRTFAGKPMICHSIGMALDSGLFSVVAVSTDDEEIATISRDCGALVPFVRPADLANDFAGTTEVIAHAARWFLDNGTKPAGVCCLYPTAPLVIVEDLLKAWELFSLGKWDFVFSATDFGFPIFRAFQDRGQKGLEMFFPEHFQTRSQDLPVAKHDAGQFYFGKCEAWLEKRLIFGNRSTIVPLPRWRVQDIDTEEDWKRAELIHQQLFGLKAS